jgi:mannose-6-phosphate isomerase-like protein (cupin superfamily)
LYTRILKHNFFTINIDGTDLTRLTHDDGESDILPIFSFDESRICYMIYEQIIYIIQGTAEIIAGGETVILKAGSSVLLEPNEYHQVGGVGDEKTIVLDIFQPRREDLLLKE